MIEWQDRDARSLVDQALTIVIPGRAKREPGIDEHDGVCFLRGRNSWIPDSLAARGSGMTMQFGAPISKLSPAPRLRQRGDGAQKAADRAGEYRHSRKRRRHPIVSGGVDEPFFEPGAATGFAPDAHGIETGRHRDCRLVPEPCRAHAREQSEHA